MKIRTPFYYKDFKCIAGDCTDTCCAGWEVDVDEASYKYYKSVGGDFGTRLKSVMVPSEEGGCTFTLNKGRCPFLNDQNLCDLFTELGENKLCDTCAEFPRFINQYGGEREIGLAPSCKTAGELMFGYKDSLTFDVEDTDEPVTTYNDIDPQLYFQLRKARIIAYNLIRNRTLTIEERCALYLDLTAKLQKKLSLGKINAMDYEIDEYSRSKYFLRRLQTMSKSKTKRNTSYSIINTYFDSFKEMEIINPDWLVCVEENREFFEKYNAVQAKEKVSEFMEQYRQKEYEYEQLMMYYVYRYFLNSVFDEDILLKGKIGVIGFLILRQLDVARWDKNGGNLSFTEQVDLAHLYSRQFEHSYVNFAHYNEAFGKKRKYSFNTLIDLLI